jgi:ribosomal protein L28
MGANGLREGQTRYINNKEIDIDIVIHDVMDEPCEICGKPTKKVPGKQLFARDTKDELGRPIVIMVCASCVRKTKEAQ